jgi:hypothetical protein
MTKFTKQNIVEIKNNSYSYKKINCDKEDLIISELDWQKRGLQQTASGYGTKLTTRYFINFENFNYRVYCRCFSNIGTCYIKTKNYGEIVIDAL